MKKIKCGDIVGRKSYNKDIIFLVKERPDFVFKNIQATKALNTLIWH